MRVSVGGHAKTTGLTWARLPSLLVSTAMCTTLRGLDSFSERASPASPSMPRAAMKAPLPCRPVESNREGVLALPTHYKK